MQRLEMSHFRIRQRVRSFLNHCRRTKKQARQSQSLSHLAQADDNNIFHQILLWKNSINASCARWALTAAYFELGLIDDIRLVEDSDSRHGYIAEFMKGGEVVDTADAVVVATWSKVSNTFWWTWAQYSFCHEHPALSAKLKELLLNGMGGIERFGRDDICDVFKCEDKIAFDWDNSNALSHYKDIQYIAADQIDSDGWNWRHGEEGDLLYAYYFRDEEKKRLLTAYTEAVGHWCRQLVLWRVLRLQRLTSASRVEGAELVAKYVHELKHGNADNPDAQAEPEAGQRDINTLYTYSTWLKPIHLFKVALTLHSNDAQEDPALTAFYRFLARLAGILCIESGCTEESGLDQQIFDRELCPLVDTIVEEARSASRSMY